MSFGTHREDATSLRLEQSIRDWPLWNMAFGAIQMLGGGHPTSDRVRRSAWPMRAQTDLHRGQTTTASASRCREGGCCLSWAAPGRRPLQSTVAYESREHRREVLASEFRMVLRWRAAGPHETPLPTSPRSRASELERRFYPIKQFRAARAGQNPVTHGKHPLVFSDHRQVSR